jgi:tRNA/tmRNA/rRNA uracil-C5-methylase (TrmA/RlmC/RlmD family)
MANLIPGQIITLYVEKAVVGGRMLARHEGLVVLVAGAIPGERVTAQVERVSARMAQAAVVDVLDVSSDRRVTTPAASSGGQVLSHIAYPRQCAIKAEILADACQRIGRLTLVDVPEVAASPERGYRMRARLHGAKGRIGFLHEGTHVLCDAGATGQFLSQTVEWLNSVEDAAQRGLDIAALEIMESVAGTERSCHLELRRPPLPALIDGLLSGASLCGLTWSIRPDLVGRARYDRRSRRDAWAQRRAEADAVAGILETRGQASITDSVRPVPLGEPLWLRRSTQAFFQGNRFLVEPLVQHVMSTVESWPVLDLYAGVGLFGLAAAMRGQGAVTLVEGDPTSGADLVENAAPFADATAWLLPVEVYLASRVAREGVSSATVIVDPPRTGMGMEVVHAVIELQPERIVFVSCDPATFARDARALSDGGFELSNLTLFDLFPGTAHVESVGVFDRVR